MYWVEVPFRGGTLDIRVTADHGWERDTDAHDVEWEPEGMTADEYNALGVTDAEEQLIYDEIYKASYDGAGQFDD